MMCINPWGAGGKIYKLAKVHLKPLLSVPEDFSFTLRLLDYRCGRSMAEVILLVPNNIRLEISHMTHFFSNPLPKLPKAPGLQSSPKAHAVVQSCPRGCSHNGKGMDISLKKLSRFLHSFPQSMPCCASYHVCSQPSIPTIISDLFSQFKQSLAVLATHHALLVTRAYLLITYGELLVTKTV